MCYGTITRHQRQVPNKAWETQEAEIPNLSLRAWTGVNWCWGEAKRKEKRAFEAEGNKILVVRNNVIFFREIQKSELVLYGL